MNSEATLQELESRKKVIFDLAAAVMRADSGIIYFWDMIAMACVKRAVCMIDAYIALIRSQNFVCAAALLRLHLDTLLRFFAGSLVADPHELATRILAGERLDTIPDKSGKKMRDAHLVNLFSQQVPWIKPIYEKASGYIHLSGLHVWNTFLGNDGTGSGAMAVTAKDQYVDDETRIRTTLGMIQVTDLFIQCLDKWRYRKENPKNRVEQGSAEYPSQGVGAPEP